MTSLLPPEPRDLPADRLEQRQRHLLTEITREPSPRIWPSRRGQSRRAGLAFAAVLIVVVGSAAVLVTRWGTADASAAKVRASITQGLSLPRSIRGEFTVTSRPAQPHKQTRGCRGCKPPLPTPSVFVLGADGSFSSRALAPTRNFPAGLAYDAGTDVVTATGDLGSSLLYLRTTGNNPDTTFRPEEALATWVLHALDSGDAHVTTTRFDGRDAWGLTLRFAPGDDYYDTYGARVDVIVDRETGLLLKLTQYENDPNYWTAIETIHDLELDTQTSRIDFVVPVPAGARVVRHDYGFRPATPSEAAAIVGYPPLLPADVGGRVLTELAAARRSQLAFLPEMHALVHRGAVTARYGDGLDAIIVSTRRGSRLAIVPELSARTITLAHGMLAGSTAYVSTSPTVPGYLSAYHEGLVVEITAPSAAEALAAAESLHAG